jgi:hypothetical protein
VNTSLQEEEEEEEGKKKTLAYYFEKRNPIKKVLRKGYGSSKIGIGTFFFFFFLMNLS